MRLTIVFTLFLGILTACQPKTDKSAAQFEPLMFTAAQIADSIGTVDSNMGKPFMRCRVAYFTVSGGTPELARAVSDSINQLAIASIMGLISDDSIQSVASIQAAVAAFRQSYEQFARSYQPNDGMPPIYDCELTYKEGHRNTKIICVTQDGYSFMGGAHPNAYKTHLVFDLKTGQTIDLKAIVTNEKVLLGLIEKGLRRFHGLADNASLVQSGALFDDMSLVLPANFTVTAKGLSFYYNAYEIASYATGPAEIEIPFAELAGCVDLSKVTP